MTQEAETATETIETDVLDVSDLLEAMPTHATGDSGPDQQAIQDLLDAAYHLGKGHHRAAAMKAADALNLIAEEHSIQAGGWY